MTLSNEEFMKKISRFTDVSLSLFNEKGEYYRSENLTTLTHTNKGIKVRWEAQEAFNHVLPFTHAVLHRGDNVWNVINIRPVASDVQPSELELEYDY
jgi:hypothetical protein